VEERPKLIRRQRRTKLEMIKGAPFHPKEGEGKAGQPRKGDGISEKQIASALLKFYGIENEVAKFLKCSLPNISYRIKNSQILQEAREIAKSQLYDEIEYNFISDVIRSARNLDDKNWQRVKFFIKTQMKKRGYIEESHFTTPPERPMQIQIIPVQGIIPVDKSQIQDAVVVDEKPEEKNDEYPVLALPGEE